ncbi:hypothetical protein FRC09_003035 [Ceratobasidium sp. 395]|nr:hypothetical protein FRC09_003035 [Ceratobasidium sp. 395]
MFANRYIQPGFGLRSNAFKNFVSCFGQHSSTARLPGSRGLASLIKNAEEPFPIVMVGSGNVMFGSRLQVMGIVDPNTKRAHTALSQKQSSADAAFSYVDTQIYSTLSDIPAAHHPRLILIGSHPCSRGTDIPGRDLELQAVQQFPGVPIFVEKPISTAEVPAARRVAHKLGEKKAVQRMKQIIEDKNLVVMGTNSRYYGAYSKGSRLDWWDKSREQGPIVEQATHFCDLARYFGGDVDLDTISARTVEWHEDPGKLSRLPIDESLVAPENRIPRATSAVWKYQSGAIGSMTHSTILHGTLYACEFEVYCDGYTMRLSDPYGVPVLHVRQTGQDYEEIERYVDDDPFYSEVSNLVDLVDGTQDRHSGILSSYQDACKTYELTWAIREASERARVGV